MVWGGIGCAIIFRTLALIKVSETRFDVRLVRLIEFSHFYRHDLLINTTPVFVVSSRMLRQKLTVVLSFLTICRPIFAQQVFESITDLEKVDYTDATEELWI